MCVNKERKYFSVPPIITKAHGVSGSHWTRPLEKRKGTFLIVRLVAFISQVRLLQRSAGNTPSLVKSLTWW